MDSLQEFLYYKMPDDIRSAFTKEVLEDFKKNLDEVFKVEDKRTLYDFYAYIESTCGFVEALKKTCKTHKLHLVEKHYDSLEWYHSDLFDGELTDLLVQEGIIEEGEPYEDDEDSL